MIKDRFQHRPIAPANPAAFLSRRFFGRIKKMKSNKLIIKINKPVHEVFAFTLNPAKTPSWISFIVKEEVNEKPTKIGTIFRNQNQNGKWSEYTVTAYEENKIFIFTSGDGNYSVKYTFTPVGEMLLRSNITNGLTKEI